MTASRYDVNPHEWGAMSSHAFLFAYADGAGRVLDVGCSTGGLARALMDTGNDVIGVDVDSDAVAQAKARGVDARLVDLSAVELSELFAGEEFDCIIFGDVLEHLVDPGAVLESSLRCLAPDGFVALSVPNVGHASVVLSLLLERWDGRDVGLLDRTHLRFFTLETLFDLAQSSGFMIDDVTRVVLDMGEAMRAPTLALRGVEFVPRDLVAVAQSAPEATTLQFVCRLVPIAPRHVHDAREALVDARIEIRDLKRENFVLRSELERIRVDDARVAEALLDQLRQRDALIGMEAMCGTLRFQLTELDAELHTTRESALLEIASLKGSVSWKVGRLFTAPLRVVRHLARRASE